MAKKKLTLGFYRKIDTDDKGHYRWYGANYDPLIHKDKKKRPKLPTINLYDYPNIKTEKDFTKFIYNNFGEGIFMVLCYKGRENTFVFWKGEINKRGFLFYKNTLSKKEIRGWKKIKAEELASGDIESAKLSEKIIEEIKKESKEQKNKGRYGFLPYLRPSNRRGEFMRWNDEEIKLKEHKWGSDFKKENENKESWGKIESPQFKKW